MNISSKANQLITGSCLIYLTMALLAQPLAAKKGADRAWIEIESAGDVSGAIQCEERLGADSTAVLCNKGGGFVLSENITAAVGAGSECFSAGYTDATAGLDDNRDGSALAYFRFWGTDRSGTRDVLYVLEALDLDGWDPDAFPPAASGDEITMVADEWVLKASNKRQSKNACLGENNLEDITVTFRRL